MNPHATTTIADRTAGFERARHEVGGRRPQGPFEFSENLDFDLAPSDSETEVGSTLRMAVIRDSKHASAGPVYMRRLGMSLALRWVYEGGKKLLEGGAK